MNPSTKHFYLMDIVKFVMCIFIIALHTKVATIFNPNLQYWITKGIFRLGVPFFFVTSGFFLGKQVNQMEGKRIKDVFVKYTKRLGIMLLVFEPISIILYVIDSLYKGISIGVIGFRIIREIVFYPPGALWFIQACIVGSWIIYFFLKKDIKVFFVWIIAVLLYLVALVCNSYYFVIDGTAIGEFVSVLLSIVFSLRNGIFVGFPLLFFGMQIQKIRVGSKKLYLCLSIVFYALYLLELALIKNCKMIDDESLFIMLPMFSMSFVLLLSMYYSENDSSICKHFRHLSTGMYLLHKPILNIIAFLSVIILGHEMLNCIVFFIVVVLSIIICELSYRSRNRFINRLLR